MSSAIKDPVASVSHPRGDALLWTCAANLHRLCSSSSSSDSRNLPYGRPAVLFRTKYTILHHSDYISGYSEVLSMPLWTSYTVSRQVLSLSAPSALTRGYCLLFMLYIFAFKWTLQVWLQTWCHEQPSTVILSNPRDQSSLNCFTCHLQVSTLSSTESLSGGCVKFNNILMWHNKVINKWCSGNCNLFSELHLVTNVTLWRPCSWLKTDVCRVVCMDTLRTASLFIGQELKCVSHRVMKGRQEQWK